MMTKTAYYMQMAQEAAAQITGSKEPVSYTHLERQNSHGYGLEAICRKAG